MSGHCGQGCPYGPSLERMAKRSTNVSYVPLAMQTGHVTELEELRAKVVVMAAGCVETPRLWLNSKLPHNPWVGRGLTNHYMDMVTGTFDEDTLMKIIGSPDINPFVGHTSGARLDYPGLGMIENIGESPGLSAQTLFGFSQRGYNKFRAPQSAKWEQQGRLVGSELEAAMKDYTKTLTLSIITDDEVHFHNRVELDPHTQDEHGAVPLIHYTPTKLSHKRREQLVHIATHMLQKSGARNIHRTDLPPNYYIHLQSTMRMGFVVDPCCEAYQVERLYIADNSVDYNSLGGPNPTLTTQALATRTAEKLASKYFR